MRITWDHLLIPAAGVDFQDLLSEWRWLVNAEHRPFLISALGDLFLQHRNGRIYWLNTGSGEFSVVAANIDEFRQKMVKPEFAAEWFLPQLIGDLLTAGLKLGPQQCFGYITPPVLGGAFEVSNFEPTDLSVHFGVTGQIHRQVKDLPPGTPIGKITLA